MTDTKAALKMDLKQAREIYRISQEITLLYLERRLADALGAALAEVDRQASEIDAARVVQEQKP